MDCQPFCFLSQVVCKGPGKEPTRHLGKIYIYIYKHLDLSKRAPKMLQLTTVPRRFCQGEPANLARIQF